MGILDSIRQYNPFKKEKIEVQAIEGNNVFEFDYSQINYSRIENPNIFNQYRAYGSQVSAIENKYNNRDEFGNSLTRTVIKYLTAWKISRRLSITSTDKKTQEFLDKFIQYNNLPMLVNKIGILGEKQGNVLVVNNFEKVNGEWQVKLFPLKYIKYNYRIELDNDYKILYAEYSTTDKTVKIQPDRFEFMLMSGDIEDQKGGINTPPTTGFLLSDIDIIDKLRVIRYKALKLFASGTPVFNVQDEATRARLNEWINKTKWKVGTSVVLNQGTFTIQGMDINGIESIDRTILDHLSNISTSSSIPLFLLGHSEQAKYDNAEAQVESINALMGSDRMLYEQFFKCIVQKAIVSYNKLSGASLLPESIDVVNPPVSRSEIKLLLAHYDILRERGDMSKEQYIKEDPFIEDPVEWMKELNKQEKAEKLEQSERMDSLMQKSVQLATEQEKPMDDLEDE